MVTALQHVISSKYECCIVEHTYMISLIWVDRSHHSYMTCQDNKNSNSHKKRATYTYIYIPMLQLKPLKTQDVIRLIFYTTFTQLGNIRISHLVS